MMQLLASKAKAIAAALAPIVVGAVAKYGFDVDVDVIETLIMAAITGLTVHRVTNAPPPA